MKKENPDLYKKISEKKREKNIERKKKKFGDDYDPNYGKKKKENTSRTKNNEGHKLAPPPVHNEPGILDGSQMRSNPFLI